MGLPFGVSARRRTHASCAWAPLHAEQGVGTCAGQARARLRGGVGYPTAFQRARCSVAAPMRMQRSSAMQWGCGFVKARAGLGISPDFMQMNGARRATAGGAQIQLVHGSPRQAPAAAREASRTFLVVESAGRPDAVADRAYVVQLERRRRMGASEAGASTRRVTVHFSWLGRWEEAQESIPEGARKIPMGVCVCQPARPEIYAKKMGRRSTTQTAACAGIRVRED
jgi:hypothetical protein